MCWAVYTRTSWLLGFVHSAAPRSCSTSCSQLAHVIPELADTDQFARELWSVASMVPAAVQEKDAGAGARRPKEGNLLLRQTDADG